MVMVNIQYNVQNVIKMNQEFINILLTVFNVKEMEKLYLKNNVINVKVMDYILLIVNNVIHQGYMQNNFHVKDVMVQEKDGKDKKDLMVK